MGIDSNTNNIAFAIYKDKELIHYGKVEFGKGDIYERVKSANMVARALAKKWKVDYIAIESSVYVNSQQVAIKMAMCVGAVIAGLMQSGDIEVIAVPPRSWQSYIGNKTHTREMKAELALTNPGKSATWMNGYVRKLRKQFTIDFFNNKFQTSITDDDVADACGLGWYAATQVLTKDK